ncbi:hypothetical protein P4O66_015220, partial [Electrophorus voltai]
EASLSRMCCPECRAPLLGAVEDLPTNLLLARLLEGFHRDHLGISRDSSTLYGSSRVQSLDSIFTRPSEDALPPQHEQIPGTPGVLAKALVNYQGNGPGELSMSSGDIVSLRYQVDGNWYYGDTKGNSGLVPARMVQMLSEQSQPVALCRALYDFDLNRLDPEDRRECLGFLKGEIVTVVRRVDENWVEGKLRDKVGIFPLLFTEPNPAARRLLARGKASECAESCPRNVRASRGRIITDVGGRRRLSGTQLGTARPPDVSLLNSLNQASLRHVQSPQLLHAGPVAPPAPGKAARLASTSRQRSGSTSRSLLKVERNMNSEVSPSITMAMINPHAPPPPTESKQFPTQQLSINVCAVLYSYSPHRPEELELRKGEMVGVYGKFKEGWLHGLSLRNGKVGILPANYVMPVLRTSARFLEQPKAAIPSASTLSTRRYAPQKPHAGVLALDKVRTDGTPAAPVVAMQPQLVVSSGGAVRAPQPGGKQGWDPVRMQAPPTHRVSPQRSSYHTQNPAPSLQPPAQDLGQMYGIGRSPVLPRKKNGLFTNPIRPQHWTYEGMAPSCGGHQAIDAKYTAPKETSTAPQSILVKPDSYKYNTEKPAKSVRFSTEELPQTTTRVSSLSTGTQIKGNSQTGPVALEYWNPSAILGRDGSASVLKDTKALQQRKGQNQAAVDSPPLSIKTSTVSGLPSPSRHRVVMGYSAQTDAELNLLEGEMVLVQKPRPDGRVLITREITGKTGLFHSSVLEVLDKVV